MYQFEETNKAKEKTRKTNTWERRPEKRNKTKALSTDEVKQIVQEKMTRQQKKSLTPEAVQVRIDVASACFRKLQKKNESI